MASDSMESNFVSMKHAVEFLDIQDQYSYNDDLHCNFKFNDYTSQEGDRIAIFKLGWTFVKDYVVFEWAPVGSHESNHSVTFNKHILPKNTSEIYQMCYISGENELHGASSPFQFCSSENQSSSIMGSYSATLSVDSMTKSQAFIDKDKDQQISRLKEEITLLRESLKAVIAQKNRPEYNDVVKDISELREVTDGLKAALILHQKEINLLKLKVKEGAEEYRKLYLEKYKVEKKYEKLKNIKEEEVKPAHNEEFNFDIGELKSIPPFPFSK